MSGFLAHLQERSPSIIALFFLSSAYVVYRISQLVVTRRRRSQIMKKNGCKPYAMYPHKDPVFGLDLFVENVKLSKTGGIFERIVERYQSVNGGVNTFGSLLLGDLIINTAEPDNIKAILATQFKDFNLPPRRKESFQPVFGHGIFTTDNEEWEASRALLRPNFARSQVGDIDTFDGHISKLISKIPRDGSTVDLQELFFMLTLDSATEFLFGKSTDVLGSGESTKRGFQFSDAFGYVTDKIGLRNRVGKLGALLPDTKWTDSVKFVHEYVGSYTKTAFEKGKSTSADLEKPDGDSSRYVFLEELAKMGYSEKKIQDELLNILLAGRDTTASLLAFVWYTLARRPDVFNKLRAEVMKLDNPRPSFPEIKELKYLQYVLNEALRLYPVVPGNARVAVKDTTLPLGGGPDGKCPIYVKKGQQVGYHVYVMHRRKDLFGADADEFKPERWETLRPSWQYLPFNGGPRICIGQQFALTEASYTTIRILQAFKSIEAREFSPIKELMTLTMAVRGGVQVGLTPA